MVLSDRETLLFHVSTEGSRSCKTCFLQKCWFVGEGRVSPLLTRVGFFLINSFQELSGFFVYCTQILAWLPPLIFTGLVEADISQTYAVVATMGFFLIAIVLLRFAASWDDILRESGRLGDEQGDDAQPDEQNEIP